MSVTGLLKITKLLESRNNLSCSDATEGLELLCSIRREKLHSDPTLILRKTAAGGDSGRCRQGLKGSVAITPLRLKVAPVKYKWLLFNPVI